MLEGLLNDDAALSGSFDVVNAGVSAYTVWQSSIFVEEHAAALEPDLVVLYHLNNDSLPMGVIDENNFLYEVKYTDRELYERRRLLTPVLHLLYASRFYLGLRHEVTLSAARLPRMQQGGPQGSHSPRVPREDRRQALERIHATCQDLGIPVLVLYPTYWPSQRDDLLPSFAGEHDDVHFLDLDAARSTADVAERDFFLAGSHPTATGHAWIAGELHDWFVGFLGTSR